MMMRLSCRQCRKLLPGYIGRELMPKEREKVSRHLNTCSECYVVYSEQRQLMHELAYSLPRIGAAPRLDKIRAGIMAEMRQPPPKPSKISRARVIGTQARYSFAAFALMLALLLPWSIQNRAFALPTLPEPETLTQQGTPIVYAATEAAPTLTATLQSNYAPATPTLEAVASATEAP
jgi:anti-sigma factor RsiW